MRHSIVVKLPLVVLLLAGGCPVRNQSTPWAPDGAAVDADPLTTDGGAGDSDSSEGPNTIAITAPAHSPVYINGAVRIAVTTDRPTTRPILVRAGSIEIGVVTPPATDMTWDTASVPEGAYSVTASWTDDNTGSSAPVEVVVDRTPPVITSLSPTPNASTVIVHDPVAVLFSEPVVLSQNLPWIALTADGHSIPVTTAQSDDGTSVTARITSKEGLTLPAQITATIAAGATDRAGNPLVSQPWSWNVPEWVKFPPVASIRPPAVAIGPAPDFRPYLLYAQCAFTPHGCDPIFHVAYSGGQAWDDLGAIPKGVAAALATDGIGRPTVSSSGLDGSTPALFVSRWNGTTWDLLPPAHPEVPDGFTVDATVVRIAPDGQLFVCYREVSSIGDSDVGCLHWDGSVWDSFGTTHTTAQQFDLQIGTDDKPLLGVVGGGYAGIEAWAGGGWIPSASSGAMTATFLFDSTGNPVMLADWWPVHLTGGSWLAAVPTAVMPEPTGSSPSIASGPNHEPIVAWIDSSPSPGGVHLTRWTGSTWTNASIAQTGYAPDPVPPTVVVDDRGVAWLAWSANGNAYLWASNS